MWQITTCSWVTHHKSTPVSTIISCNLPLRRIPSHRTSQGRLTSGPTLKNQRVTKRPFFSLGHLVTNRVGLKKLELEVSPAYKDAIAAVAREEAMKEWDQHGWRGGEEGWESRMLACFACCAIVRTFGVRYCVDACLGNTGRARCRGKGGIAPTGVWIEEATRSNWIRCGLTATIKGPKGWRNNWFAPPML